MRSRDVPGVIEALLQDLAAAKPLSEFGRVLFRQSPAAMLLCDPGDHIVAANDAYRRLTGYPEVEVLGKALNFNHAGQQDESFYAAMRAALLQQGRWSGEFWLRNTEGEAFAEKVARFRLGSAQEPIGFLTLSLDMAGFDDAKRLMLWQAHHDTLTKLPNRNLFQERLSRALLRTQDRATLGALLSIDLDRFQMVNDSVGPAKGDQVLMETAFRIALCVDDSDTVARLGGDQFAVLMTEIEDVSTAEHVGRRIIQSINRPFQLGGPELFITASIGVAVIPEDGTDTGELLQKADAARIQIKEQGGNSLAFFEPEMTARAGRRLELESGLRRAIGNRELLLHYQPVMDVRRGRVVSVEALLRWQHPELGMVSPAEFIPVAEDMGLIVDIGLWVLEEGQRQLRAWRTQGLAELRLSLNVSAVQLRHGEDLDRLLAMLAGSAPGDITLELTESALMENSQGVQRFLREARALGSQVALDDFGTGFSSLSYLRDFEFDVLKIDKTFIDKLSSARDYGLVASIVSMGRILGMHVVAEGVETAAQLKRLQKVGCDLVQGYYYSRPLPADELFRFAMEREPK